MQFLKKSIARIGNFFSRCWQVIAWLAVLLLATHLVAYQLGYTRGVSRVLRPLTPRFEFADTVRPPQFIGNLQSHVFHLRSCSALPCDDTRAYFYDLAVPSAFGFVPCGSCLPASVSAAPTAPPSTS